MSIVRGIFVHCKALKQVIVDVEDDESPKVEEHCFQAQAKPTWNTKKVHTAFCSPPSSSVSRDIYIFPRQSIPKQTKLETSTLHYCATNKQKKVLSRHVQTNATVESEDAGIIVPSAVTNKKWCWRLLRCCLDCDICGWYTILKQDILWSLRLNR